MRYTSSSRRLMSVAKTFSRQNQVPRLPLPTLEQTVEKYLRTVEPFAKTKEELEHTKKLAQEFLQDKEVRRRQASLETLAKENVSWLEKMWLNIGYLQWRVPLPINSNVTGYLIGQHRKRWPQAWSAAALSFGCLQYHLDLLDEVVPINMAKDKPQSMDQYSRMFGLTRIPGVVEDTYFQTQSRHIAVICGRRIYTVEVWQGDDQRRRMIPLEVLHAKFQSIVKDAKARGDDPFSVPVLTAGERTSWAHTRNTLQSLTETNRKSLNEVESAIFTVSLDFHIDTNDAAVATSTLVGDGRGIWFDKSFTVVVMGDGNPSIHIEHSWADAPTPLDMFFNHALPFAESVEESQQQQAKDDAAWPPVQELSFNLSPELKQAIRDTENQIDASRFDSDIQVVNCVGLGKPVWKQAMLSPDAAVQMAMQLAYRRLHGGQLPVATYETIGMSNFANGRTEACRVVSTASERFVKSALFGFLKTRSETDRKLAEKELRAACDQHIDYIVQGQKGNGVDRHLLGLRLQSLDGSQPSLFQDALFSRSGSTGSFVLSTSNNSYIPRPFAGMFGSGLPHGYGVCYIPKEEGVYICVESKKSCPETDSLRFCKMVNECLMDVATIAGVNLPKSML